MEKIIIKKSGLYFSFWDEDTLSWTDRLISDSDLPITWYFQYSIEIEEFLTISDLLLLFAQYQEDLEFAFSKSLLIVPFDICAPQKKQFIYSFYYIIYFYIVFII